VVLTGWRTRGSGGAGEQLLHILASPKPYLDQLPPHFWKYLTQSFLEFKYGAPALADCYLACGRSNQPAAAAP